MATFAMNSNTYTLLDIIRKEGYSLAPGHCGYKYIMANLGTVGDFKVGRISHIRRKQRAGSAASYVQLRRDASDDEVHKIFVKFFKRQQICTKGSDASDELVQKEWIRFKAGVGEKIKSPSRAGGKVTYSQLIAEGKSHEDICTIFNARRRKFEDMTEGSYRHEMRAEFEKMIALFNIQMYNTGARSLSLSSHFEKHSKTSKPVRRTSFCQAVARMMTLVRLSHKEGGATERNWKTKQIKEQKKVANDKRTTKYNAMKDRMGVDNFNKMKARDQEAKEVKAAEKISREGVTGRTAKFVKWRTETVAGKAFDNHPKKAAMSPYVPIISSMAFSNAKNLGFTNHRMLAGVLKRCLDNPRMYSNLHVKFAPDTTDATSQLYQYAPIFGRGPSMLRKTRDADTSRTFRVCGLLKHRDTNYPPGVLYSAFPAKTEYYIQPSQRNGAPMRGNVYYSLPTEWKDYEKWTGFGIMGNPQNSTNMETLFKIVDNNITEVSFVAEGNGYKVGYTSGRAMTFDNIFAGIRRVPTAAAAAAILAEEEKRRRAQVSRAKETARRIAAAHGEARRWDHRPQAKLAEKLANGEIDMDTFNTAMAALD
jgi:hypothetical protein